MATLTKDSIVAGHKLSNLILEYKQGCTGCIFYSNNNNEVCTSHEEEINSIAKIISN